MTDRPRCPVLHAVTPYGRNGGSSRVRVFTWLDHVRADAVVHCYLGHRNNSASYVLRRPLATARAESDLRRTARRRPERLLLHREASPVSRGGIEAALLRRAGFAVYDFDDALQCDDGGESLLRRMFPKSRKALTAARLADRVIAGNATLADWASEHNDDVVVIPSCVAVEAYVRKAGYELTVPPRLGWIGSPSEEKQLALIERPLHELHRRTGARLVLIGGIQRRLGTLEALIDRVPWSEQAQRTWLARLDVGLMPMVDQPYERGKCGYKLLQYGAAGLPALASPVGVNATIQQETQMPAPRTPDEWIDALTDLLAATPQQRAAMGQRAREVAERSYSYRGWRDRWLAAVGLGGVAA